MGLISLLCLTASPAWGAASDDARGRTLFKQGEKLYNAGDFSGALSRYTEAYELTPLPGFLFNIAQCHRQLSEFERAAFFYGRFVDLSKPRAQNVELAAKLRDEMQERQAEKVAAERKAEEERRDAEAKAAEAARHDAPVAVELVPATKPLELPSPPPPPPPETPVYKKAWFWTVIAVGVTAIAVGATAGAIASKNQAPLPAPPLSATSLPSIDAR